MRTGALATLLLMALAACGTGQAPVDYGDPTVGDLAITVALTDPAPHASVTAPRAVTAGTVTGLGEVAAVSVAVDDGSWLTAAVGAGAWTRTLDLLPGVNEVSVRGLTTAGDTDFFDTTLRYDGAAPGVRVLVPLEGVPVDRDAIPVVGVARAAGDATLVSVDVAAGAGAWVAAALDGESFEAEVSLAVGDDDLLRVRATDSLGESTTSLWPLVADDVAPALTVASPGPGSVHASAVITVSGQAGDDHGLERVEVQVGDAGWILASGTANFEAEVGLAPGPNTIQVRALDLAGHTALVELAVYRSRTVTLHAQGLMPDGAAISLTVDKAAVTALIGEADAKAITMVRLDIRGLLVEAIKEIFDPEAYGLDPGTWGTAELNMRRVVTMTPDDADVTGTSIEPLIQLAGNLAVPVPTLLAEIADVGVSDTFLTVEQIAAAVFDNVVATHPAMEIDPADGVPKLPITLYDALHDLAPLGEKLGPSGAHPGVLYDSTTAPVMLPNFTLTISGTSNLVPFEGVDLSSGKAWLFGKAPGVEVVTLDFLDPAAFSLSGLASEPEVDLFVNIVEHPGFVAAGHTEGANPEDGFPKGDGEVWSVAPWTVEHMVADAMYRATRDLYAATGYQQTWTHDVGTIQDAATITWDRGWVEIDTAGGIGSPPPPAYWWDVVLELAQVRLHDGGLAEGTANLHLPLTGVRVPVTDEELLDGMRPVLEEQKTALAAAMVGDHSSYSSACDVFLVTGEDGRRFLYYVRDDDVPGAPVIHGFPGFFEDPGLTSKVSTTASLGSGDAVHEKMLVKDGVDRTVYVAEHDGTVWELVIQAPEPGAPVQILLSPVAWQGGG